MLQLSLSEQHLTDRGNLMRDKGCRRGRLAEDFALGIPKRAEDRAMNREIRSRSIRLSDRTSRLAQGKRKLKQRGGAGRDM